MFLGTFSTKLLPKKQFVLPARLARNLKSDRLVIAQGFDKCIFGFDIEQWQKIAEAELLKPLLSEDGRRMRREIFSKADEVDLDKQRRFVIPEYLLKHAGINEEMTVIGAGDHFEIWDKDEYDRLSHSGIT
ncbi:MAG: division/cell wall cluster transcriptional repressor MraZ [bacterium]|nr:division/cell wall cluster transcriptional repressor MraZ [bacterium]